MLAQKLLPHTTSALFLTDGGLETTLVFLKGFDLPCFAAFDLLKNEEGYNELKAYYRSYLAIAESMEMNFILESPTWRANPDWIETIGYPKSSISEINSKAIQLLVDVKKEFEHRINTILISGCVGPRGDGYTPQNKMTVEDAQKYHSIQIDILSQTPVDLISAITMNYVEEAIGITLAANANNLHTVISFTLETDGKLPSGMGLREAIAQVDQATENPPIYYMLNCAHPTHFFDELQKGDTTWTSRIKAIRANASCKSHSELDEATELDRGNPLQLGLEHKKLKETFSHLNVFGGCCGTDQEHVYAIASQVKLVERDQL
jgi:S-methylmethionine-dependent homocysteine/selenocysteine methylase